MTDSPIVVTTVSFSPASQVILSEAANRKILCMTRTDEFLSHLQEAEVLCAYRLPDNVRELAPNLRWLQYPGAGVDSLKATGLLEAGSGVIVTTASGIHGTNISEYVFGSMLMFNRAWPEMVRLQDRHKRELVQFAVSRTGGPDTGHCRAGEHRQARRTTGPRLWNDCAGYAAFCDKRGERPGCR